MLKQIDLTNLNHITFIIILIIIFFCIIYLFKVNKQNASIEGFTQYEVKKGDAVVIDSLDNILLGGNNELLLTTLNDLYADKSEFANNTISITNQINSFKNTIESNMTTFKTDINRIMTSNIAAIQSKMNTDIITLNGSIDGKINVLTSNVSNTPPPLTVMALFSRFCPPGWQFCDGQILIAMDNKPVFYVNTQNQQNRMATPDLRGRFILGVNGTENGKTANNSLSIRELDHAWGSEKHTLTIDEMPSHNHSHTAYHDNFKHSGDATEGSTKWTGHGSFEVHGNTKGGNSPHWIMPPFRSLNYIIKKPLFGGEHNTLKEGTNF